MANTTSKLLKIALAEDGYLEKKSNKNLDSKTANAGANNYTKYWDDMCPSMNGQSWCNCFVNWCFVKAFGESAAKKLLCSTKGFSYYTPTSAQYFKDAKQWYTSNPKVGDIIYYKNDTRICHVGIVTKVDSSYVYTIEGNTSSDSGMVANGGSVNQKKYPLSYNRIAGYGRPKYDSSDSTKTTEKTTSNTTASKSYYKKCDAKYTGLVSALDSIGVDSSMENRKKIAKANNISNYSGTATQNLTLLKLLLAGKLVKA